NYNVFTQWKINLPSQISVSVGGSLNFLEFNTQNLLNNGSVYLDRPVSTKVFKPVFTPGASLSKVFNTGITAYANISAGYTPPTLSQMTNTKGEINTILKPEKAIQYEAGVKGNAGKSKKFTYQLAIYDLEITNRLIQ